MVLERKDGRRKMLDLATSPTGMCGRAGLGPSIPRRGRRAIGSRQWARPSIPTAAPTSPKRSACATAARWGRSAKRDDVGGGGDHHPRARQGRGNGN